MGTYMRYGRAYLIQRNGDLFRAFRTGISRLELSINAAQQFPIVMALTAWLYAIPRLVYVAAYSPHPTRKWFYAPLGGAPP